MKYIIVLGILFSHMALAQNIEQLRLVPMGEQIAGPLFDSLEDRLRLQDSDYKPIAKELWKMGVDYTSSYLYVDKRGNAVAAIIRLTPDSLPLSNEILILVDPFNQYDNRMADSETSQRLRYELLKKIFRISNASKFTTLRVSTAPSDFISIAYMVTVLKMRGFQTVDLLPRSPNRLSRRIIEAGNFDASLQHKGSPTLDIVQTVMEPLIETVVQSEIKAYGSKLHIEVAYALEPDIKQVDPKFCASLFGS
jgi:hypothetical protein